MNKVIKSDEGLAATNRVLAIVKSLSTVRLARADCAALRPFGEGEPVELTTAVHVTFHHQPGQLITRVKYEVSAAPPKAETQDCDQSDTKPLWTINIEMSAHWELKPGAEPTSDDARCFAIGQGLMTCHPYARETIQSLSSRMGYPPATIELLLNPWAGDEVELTHGEEANRDSDEPDNRPTPSENE